MPLAQLGDVLGRDLDSKAGRVVVDAAGNADGTHAGVEVRELGRTCNQDIGRNGEDDTISALLLAVLGEVDAHLRGQAGGAEEHGDAVIDHLDDLVDDFLLLLQREQGYLTGRSKDKNLTGAILDLTINQNAKAVIIDRAILLERSRHRDERTRTINHFSFSFEM